MNAITLSPSVLSTTTTTLFNRFGADSLAEISTRAIDVLRVALAPQTTESADVDDFINQLCAEDPRLDAAIEEGTRWVGRTFYANTAESVKTMRLKAGMSQARLAAAMGTSQSYVAKLEAGEIDVGISRVARLADVLGQPRTKVFEILLGLHEHRHE